MNGGVVSRWLYQDQLNPVAELDSSGNVIARYVYGTKINVPDYVIKGDTTLAVITDHLGSIRMLVNSTTGEVVQRNDYNEFGNTVLTLGSNYLALNYAGGLYDEHTEFVRFGARDYDPTIGRWTAKDPILFEGRLSNLYEYNLNDPVNYLDITGLQWISGWASSSQGQYIQQQATSDYNAAVRGAQQTGTNTVIWINRNGPTILDAGAVIATATGHPYAGAVLGYTSAVLSGLHGNRNSAVVGFTTSSLGLTTKNPRTQLVIALLQLGYNFLPNGEIAPANNTFGQSDNTNVKIDFSNLDCRN